jgi:endonuclease/exonuclease/phosphatase family metal-dependent hydrolase
MKYLLFVLLLAGCAQHINSSAIDGPVTVLSYNIHHANPPSKPGVIDLEAIAKVIREQQPQLVALQELDVNTKRSGATLNEAQELGKLTGMHHYFGKTIPHDGGEYGIGILSKYPLTKIGHYMLPTRGGEPRAMVTAVITLPNRRQFVFACTHLDAQRNDSSRILQINAINDILAKEKLPVVIAGDFNATPGSEVVNRLDSRFTRTCLTNCGFTIPEKNPTKTIDFIAYAPQTAFDVIDYQVIDEPYASDHLPVKAILKIK